MATRDVLDNRIDVWKDQYKDDQGVWRANSSTTGNYGQVLRGNGRPSDQPLDGPPLSPGLRADGWIDVYEEPANGPHGGGFGWTAWFEADEGTLYRRSLSVHEDGPIVETGWEVYDPNPILLTETLWGRIKRYARNTWEFIKHPIKSLRRA